VAAAQAADTAAAAPEAEDSSATPDADVTPAPPAADTPGQAPAPATDSATNAAPQDETQAQAKTDAIDGLRAVSADAALAPVLGSDDPAGPFKVRVEFSAWGAGVQRISTADYKRFVSHDPNAPENDPYELVNVGVDLPEGESPAFYPFAARQLYINGTWIAVDSARWLADATVSTQTPQGAVQSVTYRLPLV